MSATVPLVVLIPCHGGGAKLRSTLDSLVACELPDNYVETWIIENGGRTDVEEIVEIQSKRYPAFNFRYLYVERANKSHALNVCIEQLEQASLLFLTDDDVKFDSQLLVQYALASNSIERGTVFGGVVKINGVGNPDPNLKPLMPDSMLGNDQISNRASSFFLGANWASFSEDIIKAGGFDPRFGPGSNPAATGNESTMMRSLRNAGCTLKFVPEAIVWHSVDYREINDKVLNDRRHRSGVERGIRLAQEHRESRSVFRRARLRTKLSLSRWLASSYNRRAERSTNKADQFRFTCRSYYHQGIIRGWNR